MNTWIEIGPGDRITVRTFCTEMGQGIHTLAAMIAAEELRVAPGDIRVVVGAMDVHRHPHFGTQVTGDSSSAAGIFEPLRRAGAQARSMLVAAAAQRWGCLPSECTAAGGAVRRDGAALSYGLLAEAAGRLAVPQPEPTPASEWRRLGMTQRRLGAEVSLRGATMFGIDVRRPGMLYATVRVCPSPGGRLAEVGTATAADVIVVAADDAVVVVAPTTWAAFQAAEALHVRWDTGPAGAFDTAALRVAMLGALAAPGILAAERGTAPASGAPGRTVSIRFEAPPLAHAPLEPPCATVEIGDGRAEVWAPTQSQTLVRDTVARAAGLLPERVHVHTTATGGSFGRKLYADFVRQAALAALAAGRPVKLLWPRAEDIAGDLFRPPAMTSIEVGLDGAGMPSSWVQRLAVPALPSPFAGDVRLPGQVDHFAVEGADAFPYDVPHHRLTWHEAELPLRIGYWRSVGHSFNAWFIEHGFDIVAREAGHDPFALRVALLRRRPRHLAVLRALEAFLRGPAAPGRFRGVAVHESYGTVVGQVAEISLGAGLRVHRVLCAVECGLVLDPDGVRAQIEGGVVFGLTAALHGEITLQGGQVQQRNFDTYRLMTAEEAPEIEVVMLPGDGRPAGVGEVAVPPAAPAVCNAVLAATGRPVTSLPIRI